VRLAGKLRALTIVFASSAQMLLAAGVTVPAADLSPLPAWPWDGLSAPFSWAGLYGGVNAGWGLEHDGGAPICIGPSAVSNGGACPDDAVGGSIHAGEIAGAQIGYNWQLDRFVFGVETDFQWSNVNGETDVAFIEPALDTALKTFADNLSHQWFGTLRGRFGVAWGHTLFYVSGGLAYARIAANSWVLFENGATSAAGGDFLRAGWVAAAGIEQALTANWSVKAEVLWYDLGTITVSGLSTPASPALIGGKTFDTTMAIYRGGINYRF